MAFSPPQTLIPQPIEDKNSFDPPIFPIDDPIDPFPRVSLIKGSVWNDTDGDGRWDLKEKPLSGWTVYLDNNRNGRYDRGERTSITNSRGEYSFSFGLLLREANFNSLDGFVSNPYGFGTHRIALKPQSSWKQTSFPTTHTVTVEPGQTYANRNFGVQKNVILPRISWIKGAVWNDTNGDGIRNFREKPLSGWTVYLDSNRNGRYDNGERTTTTNSTGDYSFAFSLLLSEQSNVPIIDYPNPVGFGTHRVALKPQSGWKQTSSPTTHTVTVEPNQTYSNRNFGVQKPIINRPPVATNDSFKLNEDTTFKGNVLINDFDPDGNVLIAEKLTDPSNGKVDLNPDGSFIYTPNANYHGPDSFTYRVHDGKGGTDKATVVLTIKPVNDAPDARNQHLTINEDTTVTGNLLVNDVDGDPLTFELIDDVDHGELIFNSNGTFSYEPDANYHGKDSFTYTVSDGKGGTDTARVYLTINPINDNPVANNDSFTLDEDTTLRINVLGNDTDVDGDRLTVKDFTNPKNGTIARNRDFEGSLTYIPNANFNGTDSFTYEVSDGKGGTDKATVYLTINPINDNPVANNDTFTLDEDTTFKGNVLTNDTDVDGDNLTAKKLTNPSNGKVELNPDGSFTYTPNTNFNGTDSFTYQVSDGEKTDTATVTLTVKPINDAPVANNDSFTLDEDTTFKENVLTNDTDVDGDNLTAKKLTNPSNGTVELNPDGSFTYTPNANFNGTDSFTYEASDGEKTDTATVTLTVNPVNGPRLVGTWNRSDHAKGLTVIGEYAYVVGDFLEIFDISNPSQPIFVQNYDLHSATDIKIVGNVAYVADPRDGLQLIDISDHNNPTLIGNYDTSGSALDVEVVGDFAHVADGESGLQIIDISDPSNPTVTGNYDTADARDVEIVGNFAYVVDKYDGLQIIDISDPSNPTLIGNYDTDHRARDVEIVGDFAYVADRSSGLQIIDISDPSHPTLIGNYYGIFSADDVEIVGNFAYVANNWDLDVIDISDPSNPTLTGNYDTHHAKDVEIVGNFAYVANLTSGLEIIDISDPSHPTLTGNDNTSDSAHDVEIVGNFAYVADRSSGLQIIDISDPSHPTRTGNYDTSGSANDVEIVGNFAYVADGSSGLQIIDISDSSHPTLTGNYDTSDSAHDVEIVGNFAYVVDTYDGLQIIDISDPTNPILTGNYDTSEFANDVEIVGNFAYVSDSFDGLQIIDISDPSNPTLIDTYDTSNSPTDVEIVGNYAYVADSLDGLQIIDISDPSNPTLIGTYDTSNSPTDVEIVGNFAYVAGGSHGLQIIDVSDPSNPTLVGDYDTLKYGMDVEIMGNYAYVADGWDGLKIIDISDFISPNQAPTSIALSDNTIAENEAINTVIGNFSTTDPDINETFTYDLVSGNGDTDNSLFTLEGNVLKTNSIFDYEGKNTYSIRVQTTDSANNTYSEVFTINISDVNEAPILVNPIPDQTITQNEAFSLTIPANTFEDVDTGDRLSYSISGLPNGLSFDAATRTISGTVTQVGNFDLVVTVTDIAGEKVSDSLILTVKEAIKFTGDDFDPNIDSPVWSSINNGTTNRQFTGSIENSLFFTGDGTRQAVTNYVDFSVGNILVFDLIFGDSRNGGENADETDGGEDVVLEYSIDGSNWILLNRYDTEEYTQFTTIEEVIPGAALTATTQFRWRQINHSNANYDNWGLDNIQLISNQGPRLVGKWDLLSYAYAVTVIGDYAYVVGDFLDIVEISNPTNPIYMGSYDLDGAWDIEIVGNYVYVADKSSGLKIIDISDPTHPYLHSHYDTNGSAQDVEIVSNYAYVANGNQGLQIIDISDLSIPTLTGHHDTSGDAWDVEIVGNYAYLADYSTGLEIIDISDPTAPSLTGNYDTSGSTYDVEIADNYAYIADLDGGLKIINISDPTAPSLTSHYDTNGFAYDVEILDNYAYVANAIGLQIIDISDPTAPSLVDNYHRSGSGSTYDVEIVGNYAYVADFDGGLKIIDIHGFLPPAQVPDETNHTTEVVNYLAIEGDNALQETSYDPLTDNRAIIGTQDDDYLLGLAQNDTRTGQDGSDIFVLETNQGTDTITDFELGVDRIGLADSLSFGSLTLSDLGEDTSVMFNNQQLALIKGIQSTDLSSDHFVEVTI